MFEKDLQSLSLFRIFFALFLFFDFAANLYPYYQDFYGTHGVLPEAVLASETFRPGLKFMLPVIRLFEGAKLHVLLPLIYPLTIILFGIGYRTGVVTVLLYIFNGYLYWRNHYVRSGADDLSHLLLL